MIEYSLNFMTLQQLLFPQEIDASHNGKDRSWTRWLEFFSLRMYQTIFPGVL